MTVFLKTLVKIVKMKALVVGDGRSSDGLHPQPRKIRWAV